MNQEMAHGVAATFFVSTEGDDGWSGKREAPDAQRTDGPFATLSRARDAVRAIKGKKGISGPINIWVRGGKYFLREPLILGAQDSGSPDAPVTYRAHPGEKPILSGGRRITHWRPYRGPILQAELPGAKGGKWTFRQLFFNGCRQTRARWPNLDPEHPIYGGWAFTEGPAEEGDRRAFKYKPGTFERHWAKPTEGEVHYFAHIGAWPSTVPIQSIDEAHRILTLIHDGWQFDVPGWYMPVCFTEDNRFYVENLLEELDQPGEWCLDTEEGRLYFWPPGDAVEPGEVVVPALDGLVDLRGASWIGISGFLFTETMDGYNFHHEGTEGCGAMYPRPGWRYCGDAVHLKDAEHCLIEKNHFDGVGGNAVYLEGYNARNTIRNNVISYAGANGICLLGSRLKHPMFNEICDNHIHHTGVLNKYTGGIFAGMSDGNLLRHNLIEYVPHHAINLSNSPHGRNVVEYNRIRFADREIADSAAINCWMEDPPSRDVERCGHIIRFNFIADVYGCEVTDGKVGRSERFPTSGIYLDNYTSNCVVYGNVIVRCTHAGILVHGGKNNLIENNIILDCRAAIRFQDYVSGMEYWKGMKGFMTGNHVLHNILVSRGDGAFLFSLHAWTDRVIAQSDRNLFFRTGDGEYVVEDVDGQRSKPLSDWRDMGYDVQSRVADPLFVDLEQDNYGLRSESPALELGIQPIDLDPIGIRRE